MEGRQLQKNTRKLLRVIDCTDCSNGQGYICMSKFTEFYSLNMYSFFVCKLYLNNVRNVKHVKSICDFTFLLGFNEAARNVSRNMNYVFFSHKIIEAGVLRQSKDLGVPHSYSEQVSYDCSHFLLITVKF